MIIFLILNLTNFYGYFEVSVCFHTHAKSACVVVEAKWKAETVLNSTRPKQAQRQDIVIPNVIFCTAIAIYVKV